MQGTPNRRSLHSASHPSSEAAGDPGRSGRDDNFVVNTLFTLLGGPEGS
jgi:hypothetical protein